MGEKLQKKTLMDNEHPRNHMLARSYGHAGMRAYGHTDILIYGYTDIRTYIVTAKHTGTPISTKFVICNYVCDTFQHTHPQLFLKPIPLMTQTISD